MEPLIPPFDPVNFDLPFTIPILNQDIISMFGILVAAGLLFGAKVAMQKAENDGLDPDILNRFVTWVVVGIFVGGHVGHVLMYESELIEKEGLVTLLKFNKGLSSFGGFFACVMLSMWYFRKEGKRINEENRSRHAAGQSLLAPMKPWAYADAALKGFVPGYCIGRLGCFSVKDHPGQITDLPLGVRGMCTWGWNDELSRPGGRPTCADEVLSVENQERLAHLIPESTAGMTEYDLFQLLNPETALHDLGFYEALWFLALTPIFFYLDRKPRFPGFFAALLVFTHMPMRVFLDTMRLEVGIDRWYFSTESFKGLTPAQMGSIAFMGLGVWIVMKRRHIEPVRITVQRLREEEAAKGIFPSPEDDDSEDAGASTG
jgi:prolipoprotein diacylglyceryltransferase